jgi:hypothetical protein
MLVKANRLVGSKNLPFSELPIDICPDVLLVLVSCAGDVVTATSVGMVTGLITSTVSAASSAFREAVTGLLVVDVRYWFSVGMVTGLSLLSSSISMLSVICDKALDGKTCGSMRCSVGMVTVDVVTATCKRRGGVVLVSLLVCDDMAGFAVVTGGAENETMQHRKHSFITSDYSINLFTYFMQFQFQ